MKLLILLTSLLLSSNSFSIEINENKTPCSKDENIEAYLFGQRIVDTVRNKDLDGLFSLAIDGELMWGPRRSFVKDKEFEQIFDQDWIDKVLTHPPDSVGWRGWMIAHGHVWYKNVNGEFKIVSINGDVKEETPNDLPIGWRYNGKILPYESFTKEWISSDNFEAFEEHFKIKTKNQDFRRNPGKYFGKEIGHLNPIEAPWRDGFYVEIAVAIDSINFDQPFETESPYRFGRGIFTQRDDYDETFYTILGEIKKEHCNELAPNLKGKCKESYVLWLGDYGGGTIGYQFNAGIYGLFELEDGKEYIVPLKYFFNKNYALNYLDKMKVNE